MEIIIGLGEYAVSDNKNKVIKTLALGSCVALTAYCPQKNVAGMVHIVLPRKEIRGSMDQLDLCYYADTAVPFIINNICNKYGCNKNRLDIQLFGGAGSVREQDIFKIGQKNIAAVKGLLKDLHLPYCARETGGICSRTVQIEVATGQIKVQTQDMII